jgi:hypothetical protein
MQEDAGVQVSERPEAKEGEQASRVVTRTLWCVGVFPQRQSLSASYSLYSLRAPNLLELAVRFIHLVTHAPGPAGGISKNEGWRVRGVNQPEPWGEAAMV